MKKVLMIKLKIHKVALGGSCLKIDKLNISNFWVGF